MKIRGRIIRIVDEDTIIINLGSNEGITTENLFSILGTPENVIDPVTNESLGSVLTIKDRVKAIQIYEKFTIARSKWAKSNTILPSFFETKKVTVGENLYVNDEDIEPWKSITDSPIKVGDRVEVSVKETEKIVFNLLKESNIEDYESFSKVIYNQNMDTELFISTGIQKSILIKYAKISELLTIPGISTELLKYLQGSLIFSLEDLIKEDPEKLYEMLSVVMTEDSSNISIPSISRIKTWISRAKNKSQRL